jgi:hypothetical protein
MNPGGGVTGSAVTTRGAGELASADPETLSGREEPAGREAGVERDTAMLANSVGIKESSEADTTGISGRAGMP